MIAGLWILLRLGLLALLVVWLADEPGSVHIVWRDLSIDTSAAVLIAAVLLVAYGAVLFHRLWRMLAETPRLWRAQAKAVTLERGVDALTQGFTALAAAHPAEAGRQAVKARRLLGETPLMRLLLAQAAQLSGDEKTARGLFLSMTRATKTAVFGYRGLIAAALRGRDFVEAERLARLMEGDGRAAPWVHLVRFEASARQGRWNDATLSLAKARKGKALPVCDADRHEAVLLLADAKNALRESQPRKALDLAERAKRLRPDWTPAAMTLAEAMIVTGHTRAALRLLDRAWRTRPHPHLLPLILWAIGSLKPLEAYKIVEKLTRATREAFESRMALAEAALKADLWGEARRHLLTLEAQGRATALAYQALARLEQRENGDDRAAAVWLAKAARAKADALWRCESCGQPHETWEAVCAHCGAFGAVEWGVAGSLSDNGQGRAERPLTALEGFL